MVLAVGFELLASGLAIHSASRWRSTRRTPRRVPRSAAALEKRVVVTNQAASASCSWKHVPRNFCMSGEPTLRWMAYRLHWTTTVRPSGCLASTSAPRSPAPPGDPHAGEPVALEQSGDQSLEILPAHPVCAGHVGVELTLAGIVQPSVGKAPTNNEDQQDDQSGAEGDEEWEAVHHEVAGRSPPTQEGARDR